MDLKIEDVCELLNVSKERILKWLGEGKIPGYKLKDQYRFNRHEIENWMLHAKPEEAISQAKGGTQHFLFYRSIHQGGVLPSLLGSSNKEVIRNTTRLIAGELNVDAEVLAELLLDREELMPTTLNRGVAVPHTRDFLGKETIDRVFVVYPEKPLEYGALDKQPVHTLFFLFASTDKSHLHLLAKIAHFCSDEQNLKLLKTHPAKAALLSHIRAWEE